MASMSLLAKQCLHTLREAKLVMYANITLGLSVKVDEWNRLLATQKEYVAKGVSWTLNSKHLDKCATDLYIAENGAVVYDGARYRAMGEYWESIGGRWGGRFLPLDPKTGVGKDPYHFESSDA